MVRPKITAPITSTANFMEIQGTINHALPWNEGPWYRTVLIWSLLSCHTCAITPNLPFILHFQKELPYPTEDIQLWASVRVHNFFFSIGKSIILFWFHISNSWLEYRSTSGLGKNLKNTFCGSGWEIKKKYGFPSRSSIHIAADEEREISSS